MKGIKIEGSLAFSHAWNKEISESETRSESSSIAVSVDVLAEHRMYAYVTADTYKTKVPWRGKMTKLYWNGEKEVENVQGIYEGTGRQKSAII